MDPLGFAHFHTGTQELRVLGHRYEDTSASHTTKPPAKTTPIRSDHSNPQERRGTSHGVSIRVARGIYYRPSTFRSRPVEWEETVHADTRMLGLTTKHIYFAGRRKKFRVRYDRIVAFDPYDDGFGIMRDAQTAKPQTFVTGDGWLVYNLAANLAQM